MKRLLFVVLLLAGVVVVPVGPTEAAACSGTSGVTVVVQFPDGHIETGCAPGDPSNGIGALTGAGFTYEPVPGQQGATVCRINGQPAAGEKCWQPPDYWAYFHAERGGSWDYSTVGVGSYDPEPGTVEGWKFRGSPTNKPGIPPPGSPTPTVKSSPHPTTRPTSGASNPVVGPDETVQPTPTQPTASSSGSSTTPTPGATATATATDDGTPSVEATDGPGGTAVGAPTATRAKSDDGSGGLSWIWGVLLIVALAAGAGATAVRRRRS